MRASVGDRVVVAGHRLGDPERDGEVLEVHGTHGEPPFVIRWADDGHVATFVPGSDTRVEHHGITMDTWRSDSGRRDVVEGIATLRTEAARLHAALARSRDSGSATWQSVTDELTKGLARLESETAVLWAHLRTAEAESVDAVTNALEDAVRGVRTTLDGLRVQARLGRAETLKTMMGRAGLGQDF